MLSPCSLLCGLICLLADPATLPIGFPPQDESNAVDKAVPEECVLMISWAGSQPPGKKADDKSVASTGMERMLAEQEVQQSIAKILKTIEAMGAEEGPETAVLSRWIPKLLSRPGMIFIEKLDLDGPDDVFDAGAVVRLQGLGPKLEVALKRFLTNAPAELISETEIGGEAFRALNIDGESNAVYLGIVNDLFVLATNEEMAERLMNVDESMAPGWLTKLKSQSGVDRRSFTFYADVEKLVAQTGLPRRIDKTADELLGLSSLGEFTAVTGFDQTGYRTDARLAAAEGGSLGALANLLSQTPITTESFSDIPADASLAMVVNLSPVGMLQAIKDRLLETDPEQAEELEAGLKQHGDDIGLSWEDEILPAFGERVAIYHSQNEGGLLSGFTAILDVKKVEVVRKLEEMVPGQIVDVSGRRSNIRHLQSEFAGQTIHTFTTNRRISPIFAPSYCLIDDKLIFSLTPQAIRTILSRDDSFVSLAKNDQIVEQFSDQSDPDSAVNGAFFMDSPAVLRSIYPLLQIGLYALQEEFGVRGFDLGMLPSGEVLTRHMQSDISLIRRDGESISFTTRCSLPALDVLTLATVGIIIADEGLPTREMNSLFSVFSPRLAGQEESLMKLKMIGLALHNYHSAYRTFPAAAMNVSDPGERDDVEEDKEPLLSWRVHILPFIEEADLYEQFHLDEPWNSEHNIRLVEKMPDLYRVPGSKAEPTKTNYMTIRSEGSAFPGTGFTRIRDILDGTSNTLAVVEASDANAVIWSKPGDLQPDAMHPLEDVRGLRGSRFLAVLCDGSTHAFGEAMTAETFNAMVTCAGGEIVNPGELSD